MIRRVFAEALGTALLLAIVVGSGIMAERLAHGNAAVALLANAAATGAGLFTLIVVFGPISGAHFNPAVTLAAVVRRTMSSRSAGLYCVAQVCGAVLGVVAAHAMFGLELIQASSRARSTFGEALGEVIATFGLILTIGLSDRQPRAQVAAAVSLWIVAAYWFTSSTSFANPAVTLARSLTDTFSGIASGHVVAFVVCQLAGTLLASISIRLLRDPSGQPSANL